MTANGSEDEHQIETYKSLIQIGTFGLKFLQIINGGAAIALLSYLGNVTAAGRVAPDLRVAMGVFLGGLVLAGGATITVYLTQLALYNEGTGLLSVDKHMGWLWFSITLCILSLIAFSAGALIATWAFAPGA